LQFAGQVAGAGAHGNGVGLGINPQHPHGATVGADQIQQAADGGGFPGSVRPEIAKDLAALHLQVNAPQCADSAVGLGQSLGH